MLDHSARVEADWGSLRLLTRAGASLVYEAFVKPGKTMAPFTDGEVVVTVLAGAAATNETPLDTGSSNGPAVFESLVIANPGEIPLPLLFRTSP